MGPTHSSEKALMVLNSFRTMRAFLFAVMMDYFIFAIPHLFDIDVVLNQHLSFS